jgi:hypothetical protein
VDDNFRNKKITELTGQDLSNVLREGSWYSDYSQEVFKKYIGVEDFGDILFSALNISFANSLIYRFILEDFFEENNLKIEAVAQPGHSSNYAPTYANIVTFLVSSRAITMYLFHVLVLRRHYQIVRQFSMH